MVGSPLGDFAGCNVNADGGFGSAVWVVVLFGIEVREQEWDVAYWIHVLVVCRDPSHLFTKFGPYVIFRECQFAHRNRRQRCYKRGEKVAGRGCGCW